MTKPCDTHDNLPCIYMGKCRGRVRLDGSLRPLRKRGDIEVCPCEADVMEWISQAARRNAGGGDEV